MRFIARLTRNSPESLIELSQYCSEFLVHGVDVEGLRCGIMVSGVSGADGLFD